MEHIEIYRDEDSYCSFPDILKRANGDLVVTFREAGLPTSVEKRDTTHGSQTSRIVTLQARGNVKTWPQESKRIVYHEHDVMLGDESIAEHSGGLIISFYGWRHVSMLEVDSLARSGVPIHDMTGHGEGFWAMEGPQVVSSADGGSSWGTPARVDVSPYRGGNVADKVVQAPGGELLMATCMQPPGHRWASKDTGGPCRIVRSADGGKSWGDPTVAAEDTTGEIGFFEPALVSWGDGRMMVMIRSTLKVFYQAFSVDWGRNWDRPRRTTIVANNVPHVLVLDNGHVLCTYGRREPPFGIRACFSKDEGRTWNVEDEVVLRADGGGWDLGYPSSVQLSDGTILTVYYNGCSLPLNE